MGGDRGTGRLEDFTGYMLRLAHTRAHQIAAEAFPDGPHPREYAVLTAIAAAGPLSQQRLAERLHVNRTLMVAVADTLERRGLVERRRDPADRRLNAVHVTGGGRDVLERATAVLLDANEDLTRPIGEAGDRELRSLLRKLLGYPPQGG